MPTATSPALFVESDLPTIAYLEQWGSHLILSRVSDKKLIVKEGCEVELQELIDRMSLESRRKPEGSSRTVNRDG